MLDSMPILTIILFLPALGAIVLGLLPRSDRGIKVTAAVFSGIAFVLAFWVFAAFDRSATGLQFVEQVSWIPAINAQYFLGVDGLSVMLLFLTTFLGFLSVFISWSITTRVREYFIWLLILETSLIGVFVSLDFLLFFVFWEIEMIPMYFLISIWGTPPPLGRKEYSAIKYILYTFTGSAMLLAGILVTYFQTGSWNMMEIGGLATGLGMGMQTLMFFLIFFCFAVKLPMFPLHTWLPDAHTDAPTAGSVILAGVLIKMGGYGMIRACVSMFPGVARDYAPLLVTLAVVSIIYGAVVTLRQTDLKRLIAYSSISHMGYVLLGIFALTQLSITGAALQMFSHGLITGLLFAMVGIVYEHSHERRIPLMGGLARQMPIAAVIFIVAGLASLGLPTTSGFAAEFITFMGSFSSSAFPAIQVYTAIGILGIVLTAGYILWMLERVFYKEPREEFNDVPDADGRERAVIFTFIAVIMIIGIFPQILTDIIKVAVLPIAQAVGL